MFNFFKKRIEKKSAPVYVGYGTPPSLWGGGPESASGIAVTPATSLECATVLACVRLLANGMAQVPFRLFQMSKSGIRTPAVSHPLYDLLYTAPNEYQTSFEFFHTVMMHLALTGNAYVWINRRADGKILELLPYPPGTVAIDRDEWEVKYSIRTQDGQWVNLPAEDMWHIRWLAWDGVKGLSAVQMARDAIGLALAVLLFYWFAIPAQRYRTACQRMEQQEYYAARRTFRSLLDYKDSYDKAGECTGRMLIGE